MEKDYVDYDPFLILNVDKGATKSEIKKAYRELSLKYHPDKEGGDDVKFMQISKAHAALTDEEAKENWEKYGNPDGPKAATFGIALPSWIVDKNNSIYVLGIYVACFMVILPIVVSMWWAKSNKTAGEKIHVLTNQLYHDYIHRYQITNWPKNLHKTDSFENVSNTWINFCRGGRRGDATLPHRDSNPSTPPTGYSFWYYFMTFIFGQPILIFLKRLRLHY